MTLRVQGSLRSDGIPKDVDDVIPVLFTIFKEQQSSFAGENLGLAPHQLEHRSGEGREHHGAEGHEHHGAEGREHNKRRGLERETTDDDIDREDDEANEVWHWLCGRKHLYGCMVGVKHLITQSGMTFTSTCLGQD